MRVGVTFRALTRLYNREMGKISFRNDILPLKDKLYRLALRITFDAVEAEDIVQDTMIKVWNRREEWERYDSIEAYCVAVCKNLALDRKQRKDAQHLELNENLYCRSDFSTPHEHLMAQEGLQLLKQIMEGLPPVQQEILQLREIEGKAYKEIATVLNLSEEQVKVYLFRARQRIKQRYTEIQDYGL